MKSQKSKGSRLEYEVRDILRSYGYKARRTPMSGAIDTWKEDVTTNAPFFIECKNRETWNPLKWYKDTEQKTDGRPVLLVLSRNREKTYCFMEIHDFMRSLTKKKIDPIKKPTKPKATPSSYSGLAFPKSAQIKKKKK